jgi:hypothetical protein
VSGPAESVERVRLAGGDLAAAGRIAEITYAASDGPLSIAVELADTTGN